MGGEYAMTDLSTLIERVRKATGPDRELDGEIDAALRVGVTTLPDWAWNNFPVWKHISNGIVCVLHDSGEHGLNWSSQPFTASVDAALGFAERLEGHGWFAILVDATRELGVSGTEPPSALPRYIVLATLLAIQSKGAS